VFPLELPHAWLDYLLCELGTGNLRSLIVHLSEGYPRDSSAHHNVEQERFIAPGLVFVHGTALRSEDFAKMTDRTSVGLVWSPRSNDEFYGRSRA
jgi:hypothetical protein